MSVFMADVLFGGMLGACTALYLGMRRIERLTLTQKDDNDN